MKAEKANWFDRYLELATAELEWEFGRVDLFAPAELELLSDQRWSQKPYPLVALALSPHIRHYRE